MVVLRDYAHTPDAMTRVLATLRPLTPGRLILIFGCGGDRDRAKRPEMARIAVAGADLVAITPDNPRTEDPERIMDDMESGMGGTHHLRFNDREVAIHEVLADAGPGDTVLLAGKGHETYQLIGTTKFPFDERTIVRAALEGRS
jgi:UDP-N-acetylmuramoyl-L-alanyl-D-glutamate--2,6-diaminopimelate ligase